LRSAVLVLLLVAGKNQLKGQGFLTPPVLFPFLMLQWSSRVCFPPRSHLQCRNYCELFPGFGFSPIGHADFCHPRWIGIFYLGPTLRSLALRTPPAGVCRGMEFSNIYSTPQFLFLFFHDVSLFLLTVTSFMAYLRMGSVPQVLTSSLLLHAPCFLFCFDGAIPLAFPPGLLLPWSAVTIHPSCINLLLNFGFFYPPPSPANLLPRGRLPFVIVK